MGFFRGQPSGPQTGLRVRPGIGLLQRLRRSLELGGSGRPDPILDPSPEGNKPVGGFGGEIPGYGREVQEIMDALRLKFKAVCGSMGLKLDYMYISESRNRTALETIERAAKLISGAHIVNKFEDETYNRVGYTVVSMLSQELPLKNSVFSMVKAALESIDLESHSGSHPRLGVVDHICFHPFLSASLDHAASVAKSLASDIGHSLQVPTFLYGSASEERKTLDSIRRELGFFKPNSEGNQWCGGIKSDTLARKPDEGPTHSTPTKGVIVIGATPWVDNYNVPVLSTDLSAVRRIARRVSERGGGLPSVQAMALAHGEGVIEVACNLLEPSRVGGGRVQVEVERLAGEECLAVGKGYFTDLSQEKIVESYFKLLDSCR